MDQESAREGGEDGWTAGGWVARILHEGDGDAKDSGVRTKVRWQTETPHKAGRGNAPPLLSNANRVSLHV